jgi:Holliday junction resolvase-like predicted endonuclease
LILSAGMRMYSVSSRSRRATRDVKPAETAVDRDKRRELLAVARDYLHHLPPSCPWRLEVPTVYYDHPFGQPQIELFQNVTSLA